MSTKRIPTPYTRDQRELSLLIYADATGHTTATLTWRECLAGEERKREVRLNQYHWEHPINQREHALWCLVQIAKALTVTRKVDE